MHNARIVIDSDSPRISFGTTGSESWPQWDRYLLIDGEQVYHVGNICGTCDFFFEKRPHASEIGSDELSAPQIADRLRSSTDVMNPAFLKRLGSILEPGEYEVIHRLVRPVLTFPGDERDYFSNECIDLFAEYEGEAPHSPKTSYYRCKDFAMSDTVRFFDFLIPLQEPATLDSQRVSEYEQVLRGGTIPTAFSVSLLDIKAPALKASPAPVSEHWCLANYVLDGHHKIYAASRQNLSVSVLSFLSARASLANAECVSAAVSALDQSAA